MAAAFPGQFNTYIPSTEATDNLIADFSATLIVSSWRNGANT